MKMKMWQVTFKFASGDDSSVDVRAVSPSGAVKEAQAKFNKEAVEEIVECQVALFTFKTENK